MTGEVPSGASDTPPPVHGDRGIGRLASRFGSWMQQRKEYLQRIYRCTRGYFAEIWERVANRGLKYWVRLLLFLIAGGILSFWADRSSVWLEFRYRVYQHFQHILPRQPPHRETAVLLIGDDEYWKGGLRRVPFRRDYLAKLLRELDSAGAAVVILDVELRAPMPDSSPGLPLEAPEYQHETVELVETINAMSNVAHVVVPKTANKRNGRWFHEPDVVDNLEFTSSRVLRGHVLLAQEKWHIPTSLTLPEGPLDSIALAAAKAKDPALNDFLGKFSEDQLPFGGYLEREELEKNVVPAGAFLADPARYRQQVACKVVIVGGGWSSLAYKRGISVDLHDTPAGPMIGALVHANYVEAFLDRRIYRRESEIVTLLVEALLVSYVALSFVTTKSWQKLRALVLALVAGAGLGYFDFTNRGVFFDPVFPILAITLHALFEEILEWKKKAKLYDRLQTGGQLPPAQAHKEVQV